MHAMAAGSSLDRLAEVNVMLTQVSEFEAMNEIYRSYFKRGAERPRCIMIETSVPPFSWPDSIR